MNITLLNINHSTKTAKNGKAYHVAEVAYKNNTYGGKVEGFKVTSYMKGYADVSAAQIGETLDVAVVKNEGGFNEWTSATKAIPGVTPAQVPTPSSVGYANPSAASAKYDAAKQAPAFGRDFETREERAKKQVYIVRQSSISNAVSILTTGAKVPPTVDSVVALAKQLEGYIFEQSKAEQEFDQSFKPDMPDLDF